MADSEQRGVQPVQWWWVAVGFLIVTVLYVLYYFVGTLMLGFFIYYAARPFSRRLEEYIESPALAGGLALLFIALPFIVVFTTILFAAIAELASLRPETLTTLLSYLFPDTNLSGLPSDPVAFARSLLDMVGVELVQFVFDSALSVAGVFVNAIFQVLLAVLFAFYLLRDDRKLATWFDRAFAEAGSPLHRYLSAVDRDLHTVFFGTVVTIFIVIVLSVFVYTGLNMIAPPGLAIPDPVLLSVATGIATLVPMVGRALVYILVAAWLSILALTTATTGELWFPVALLVVMILGVDQVINFVVQPYFAGQTVHTGLMLFALGIGTALFGWYGVFFGPFLLVVNYEFVRLVLPEFLRGESLSTRPTGDRSQRPTAGGEDTDSETSEGTASGAGQ